jgi:hypothetical protein
MNKYTNIYIQKVGEELKDLPSTENKTKKLTTIQKIKRMLRDTVTGAAIGAGAGGLAGGMGSGVIRDFALANSDGGNLLSGISFANEMRMPKARVQAVSIPLGIAGGASLGALGGLLLPPLYRE